MRLIPFILIILSSLSCTYPAAQIQVRSSRQLKKEVQIVYPTPKIFSYRGVRSGNNWGIFFWINDYTQVSFPPPGAVIDNRVLYYFTVFDGNLNPLMKKPLLLLSRKRKGRIIGGTVSRILATEKGFLIVYLYRNAFHYATFGLKGRFQTKRKKFYSPPASYGFKNQVLAMGYHNKIIYLFILTQPENMYTDTWSINLIKRDIGKGKTETVKKFLSSKKGFHGTRLMKVHFSGETMHLALMKGLKTESNPKHKTYRFEPVIYRTECPLSARSCNGLAPVYRAKRFSDISIRFVETSGTVRLAIKNKDRFLLHEPGAEVPRTAVDTAYLQKLFSQRGGLPFRVTCGPAEKKR